MKRRSFLKVAGSVAGGCLVGTGVSSCASGSDSSGETKSIGVLPRRVLGRTGKEVSIVGFPGLALTHYDQARCTAAIHDAFKRGVNYFDVAPAYGKGDAEIKMGIGLQGIDRSRIFLACKTKMRDKEGARKELETSLEHLKTDHFDLYQMHHIVTPDQVKQALGPGGAIETFLEAKKEGKVRYFGFSAHTTKGGLAAMNGFRFDTVMFPINFIEYFQMGFGKPILELAKEQGAAVLAIKPMCGGSWAEGAERSRGNWYRALEDEREIDLALRFTLSQKPVAAGIPPSFLDLLDKAIPVGQSYRPITKAERQELKELAKTRLSLFKEQEDAVASGRPWQPLYPDSPHECCPCAVV
jgi:predicted aldo/keto reductase-like oxidoreductase